MSHQHRALPIREHRPAVHPCLQSGYAEALKRRRGDSYTGLQKALLFRVLGDEAWRDNLRMRWKRKRSLPDQQERNIAAVLVPDEPQKVVDQLIAALPVFDTPD